MRDKGGLPSGRKVDSPPQFFIGGADVPRRPDAKWTPAPLLKKIEAGADFIQTQFGFDLDIVRAYAERLNVRRHHREARRDHRRRADSLGEVRALDERELVRRHVPEATIERIEAAKDQAAEGRAIVPSSSRGCARFRASRART